MLKFICILTLSIIFIQLGRSQNVLLNGGFESHGNLDCLSCIMWPEKYASVLYSWKTVDGTYPFICDCQYKSDKLAIEQGICPFKKIMPHQGRTMIEMDYTPSCFDQEMKTRGCSSYIGSYLGKSLEIGKVYEISFWVYIPTSKDSTFAQYIGFNLYPNIFRNPKGRMLEGSKFLLDTIKFNKWFQAKWYLRPICNLQFLVLGVFRNEDGPVVNTLGFQNRFYIDDVAIKPLDESQDSSTYIVPYCEYTAQEKVSLTNAIEGVTLLFGSDDSTLSISSIVLLDSFAIRAKNNPLVAFTISGNTDSRGFNNKELSKARVNSTLEYLEKKHNIKRFRFFQIYFGSSNALGNNESESGRQINRRVEISQTTCDIEDVIYRNLLLNVFANEKDEAFKLVNIWLSVANEKKKIYLLFDPRLDPIKSDMRWKTIAIKKIKDNYNTLKKPMMAFLLDSLGKEDQKCRTLKKYIENLNPYFEAVDSFDRRFDVKYYSDTISDLCATKDEDRFQSLRKIIGNNNWPKISEIGERPAKCAFLILSHTSDSLSIGHYLPLIKQRCTEGEAKWIFYAMLYDRLQVMRGLPQRFGTQYKPIKDLKGEYVLFPLEDPTKVDQWRREIGIDQMDSNHN